MRVVFASFVSVAICLMSFSLSGCGGSLDEEDYSKPITKEELNALPKPPAPVLAPITMTFRISGGARGVVGNYTDATGAVVPIAATANEGGVSYAPLPWEQTVIFPHALIRQQKIPVRLAARDAFGSGANVTVEIWADGKMFASDSGVSPDVNITSH